MLTVADLQRGREAKARVNHETYKQLLRQVEGHLRSRAENRGSDLLWQVPPLVPGRPVYAVSHAARYITDKLRHGGFEVSVASPQPDVRVLYITWSPVARDETGGPAARRARREEPVVPRRPEPIRVRDASHSLERLKARLRVG